MAFRSLVVREFRRLGRQPARMIAAVATPALFVLVLASGLGGSVGGLEAGDGGYAAFLAPGAIVLTALFAGVFNAIALIEDRQGGLLRSLMAGPTGVGTAVSARLAAGSAVTVLQCGVFVIVLPLLGVEGLRVLPVLGGLIVVAVASQAVCLVAGWIARTTAGFHTVMNTLLMPAWLLGGAFFPIESAAGWLRWAAMINPAAWLVELSRISLLGTEPTMASRGVVWGVGVGLAMIGCLLVFVVVRRPRG